ncbi:hypothetical protein Psi02_21550 [Planotetraspora silvatica]|uniref:Uncharacterized protein n=1 Tax=Planotetraspora silvatica TaxID=234614 RepID=A0A8J3UJP4_9ACTN|nr:hypothetical protein Psi02_21550 [Planotetraspora silvatica]
MDKHMNGCPGVQVARKLTGLLWGVRHETTRTRTARGQRGPAGTGVRVAARPLALSTGDPWAGADMRAFSWMRSLGERSHSLGVASDQYGYHLDRCLESMFPSRGQLRLGPG